MYVDSSRTAFILLKRFFTGLLRSLDYSFKLLEPSYTIFAQQLQIYLEVYSQFWL